MLYTAEEVLDFLEEEDVRFVRLAFCDVFGTPRNISIPPAELKSAFASGVSFDASAVPGFTDVSHSDLFLYPDPTTLALFPCGRADPRRPGRVQLRRRPEFGPGALEAGVQRQDGGIGRGRAERAARRDLHGRRA